MLFNKIIQVSIAGCISISSWYLGSYFERRQLQKDNKKKCLKSIKIYPGLPIFGTVSAASIIPYSEKTELTTASRVSQIMKHGFPGLDNVRSFDDYVLSYDCRNRVAHWVFEHLHTGNTKHNDEVDRSKCEFTQDESIHPLFRYLDVLNLNF